MKGLFFTNDVNLDMFSTFIMIEDNYSLKWIEITSFVKNTISFNPLHFLTLLYIKKLSEKIKGGGRKNELAMCYLWKKDCSRK